MPKADHAAAKARRQAPTNKAPVSATVAKLEEKARKKQGAKRKGKSKGGGKGTFGELMKKKEEQAKPQYKRQAATATTIEYGRVLMNRKMAAAVAQRIAANHSVHYTLRNTPGGMHGVAEPPMFKLSECNPSKDAVFEAFKHGAATAEDAAVKEIAAYVVSWYESEVLGLYGEYLVSGLCPPTVSRSMIDSLCMLVLKPIVGAMP